MTYAESNVIPENILNKWGYKTDKVDSVHYIKKIEIIKGYYPRFSLSKKCFDSNEKASNENNNVLNEINNGPFKGHKAYRDYIIENGCLYDIRTGANLFYLEYQPSIVKQLREYVSNQ